MKLCKAKQISEKYKHFLTLIRVHHNTVTNIHRHRTTGKKCKVQKLSEFNYLTSRILILFKFSGNVDDDQSSIPVFNFLKFTVQNDKKFAVENDRLESCDKLRLLPTTWDDVTAVYF
jgi:hypothetical protein